MLACTVSSTIDTLNYVRSLECLWFYKFFIPEAMTESDLSADVERSQGWLPMG